MYLVTTSRKIIRAKVVPRKKCLSQLPVRGPIIIHPAFPD